MADWNTLGFCDYSPDGLLCQTGDKAPHFHPAPYDRWESEPVGTLGVEISYLARCSGVGGLSSRGYRWTKEGYCQAQSLGCYGAGLYGFVAGAGIWEVPVTAQGYVDSFQILTVLSNEIHLADDGLECAVPRAWLKYNGSLSHVALALEAETDPYAHQVAAQMIGAMGRIVASVDVSSPGHEIADVLRSEIAAYRRLSERAS